MSIKNSIDELSRLKNEITRNNARNRVLRQRMHILEEEIATYLQNKSQAGVKYKGRTIVLETKERRSVKSKRDKKRDILDVLQQLGVSNTQEAYLQLLDAQRGEAIEQRKISIRKIKKEI